MRLILILTASLAFQSAAASEFDAVRALAALGEKFCDPYEDCAEEALWDDSSQYEDTALISEADLDAALVMARQGRAAEAFSIYKKAAAEGNVRGMNNMGAIYEQGIADIPADKVAAFEWYKKSADGGFLFGKYNMARMRWHNDSNIFTDYPSAYELSRKFGKAVLSEYRYDIDSAPIKFLEWMGWMFKMGVGAGVNRTLAYDFFTRAASKGSKKALQEIGSKSKEEWIDPYRRGLKDVKVGMYLKDILNYCKAINFSQFSCYEGPEKFSFYHLGDSSFPVYFNKGGQGEWADGSSDPLDPNFVTVAIIKVEVAEQNRLTAWSAGPYQNVLKQLSEKYKTNYKYSSEEFAEFNLGDRYDLVHIFDDGRVTLSLFRFYVMTPRRANKYGVKVIYRSEGTAQAYLNSFKPKELPIF